MFTSFCDLVHGQNTDLNSELFVMSVGGVGLTQLTQSTGGVGSIEPQLAANGEIIVFASDRDLIPGQNGAGNFEIFTIRTDGTHLTQLTNTVGGRVNLGFPGNTGPCFDPKAQKITISSDRDLVPGGNADGNNDVLVMNVDGRGVRQLTFTTGGYGVDGGCLNATDSKRVFSSDRDFVGQNNDVAAKGKLIMLNNFESTGLQTPLAHCFKPRRAIFTGQVRSAGPATTVRKFAALSSKSPPRNADHFAQLRWHGRPRSGSVDPRRGWQPLRRNRLRRKPGLLRRLWDNLSSHPQRRGDQAFHLLPPTRLLWRRRLPPNGAQ